MSRIDLDTTCVPVGWRFALFGRLGRRLRCVSLGSGRPWVPSGCFSLGGTVGDHSIDSVESGLINKSFRYPVAPGLSCNQRGVILLAFTVLPYR